MELVPILSTIILVGTIATFILAVFAYILYKVREGQSRERAHQRPYIEARRQPALTTQQPSISAPSAIGQRAPASMYIPPTSMQPPHVRAHEVESARESVPSYAGPGNSHSYAQSAAPRLAPPQYESMGASPTGRTPVVTPTPAPVQSSARPSQPGSLFWEYTDAGFVPVDPQKTTEQKRQAERMRQQEENNNDSTAWL